MSIELDYTINVREQILRTRQIDRIGLRRMLPDKEVLFIDSPAELFTRLIYKPKGFFSLTPKVAGLRITSSIDEVDLPNRSKNTLYSREIIKLRVRLIDPLLNFKGLNMYSSVLSFCGSELSFKSSKIFELTQRTHLAFESKHYFIVCDFPEEILLDKEGYISKVTYRDGWSLRSYKGFAFKQDWFDEDKRPTIQEVLDLNNSEIVSQAIEMIGGWSKLNMGKTKKIYLNGNPKSDIGALVKIQVEPRLERVLFLEAICPRNGTIFEPVPLFSELDGSMIRTALEAQAWRDGFILKEYQHPTKRT